MQTLEAALIGDLHAKIMALASEDNGILFRRVMTAASAIFVDASIQKTEENTLIFQMSKSNLRRKSGTEDEKNRSLQKAKNLTIALNQIVSMKLPVYANIGMAASYFVHSLIVAAKTNRQDPSLISRKMAQVAAEEHFEPYAKFYENLIDHVPYITSFYGPTRFTPEMRHVWMAYDDVAKNRLSKIGIEIIDLRAELGREDMQLDPKYYSTNDDDQVHANADWGIAIMRGIQQHYLSKQTL